MVKAYIIKGLGIGCHEEAAYAYEKAGAMSEIVHINQLLSGEKNVHDAGILNFPGGFLHGDMLGAGMCAANIIEHALSKNGEKIKDILLKFAESGGIIYGQCNGFQLLVKTGLLPGINNDYSAQTVTLTDNDCGNYRVAPVFHIVEGKHFAFQGINSMYIMCRHGEGKLQFSSEYGMVNKATGEQNRKAVNEKHVLLRYANPSTNAPTTEFPHNPNGSIDAIAGLTNEDGNIFAHMAHTEVGIYRSRSPEFYEWKEDMRRAGFKAKDLTEKMLEDIALQVFRNIVRQAKQ
jgi:phosphoribosylformylglycinamidine synthase subunit PurQ / glutaminase